MSTQTIISLLTIPVLIFIVIGVRLAGLWAYTKMVDAWLALFRWVFKRETADVGIFME